MIESADQDRIQNLSTIFRQEVTEGLLYAHSRISGNTTKSLEAASFLYALIELLSEKGLITVEELGERKRIVGKGLKDMQGGIIHWDLGRPLSTKTTGRSAYRKRKVKKTNHDPRP